MPSECVIGKIRGVVQVTFGVAGEHARDARRIVQAFRLNVVSELRDAFIAELAAELLHGAAVDAGGSDQRLGQDDGRLERAGLGPHVDELGVPHVGDLALDAIEERRVLPLLGVERGRVAVVDVLQVVHRAATLADGATQERMQNLIAIVTARGR